MNQFIILNGKDYHIIDRKDMIEARDFAIAICDHSQEIIVREIEPIKKMETMKDKKIVTTLHYWDCECEFNYIHHKETDPYCPVCNARHEDQPDSRETELWNLLKTYQTEDGHKKTDCPICEASEHIAYIIENGKCNICIREEN